jgi:hypothetical protein
MSAEQTPDIAALAAVLREHFGYGIETDSDAWSCACGTIIWDGLDADDSGYDLDDDHCRHVAAALAPVLAAAVREAEQRALREAADQACAMDYPASQDPAHWGIWLRHLAERIAYRADRITEPASHEAAASGEEASKA